MSLTQLSTKSGLNKPSLLRIIRTLEDEDVLRRRGEQYSLGPRILQLSNVFLQALSIPELARPHMVALARECRLPVNLAILDGIEIVYVAIEQARREIGVQSDIGGRHPANATALGKVLLANLPEEELNRRLDGIELPRLTHRTLVDTGELTAHLASVRENGFAIDDEERGIGIRCIAAGVRDHRGDTVAAVSVAGPIFHVTEDSLPDLVSQLRRTADAISSELGSPSMEALAAS